MNICLACREVVVDLHGGLPRATCDLAMALARAGHQVTLVTDRSGAPVPALDGVDVVRVGVEEVADAFPGAASDTAPHNLLHAAAVWREVSRRHVLDAPVDVVLAPLWRSEGAVCALDRRWPTIVSCMTSLRTLVELDPGYSALPDLGQRLSLEQAALRRSPYLHGLTHAVLDKTILDYGLAPRATGVIGRGVADRARDGLGARREGDVHILFVGRIERRKGVDVLFAAASQLVSDGAAVRFTFAGPPADPGLMAAFSASLAGSEALRFRVTFTGHVTDAQLTALYASADVVCVPSRYESHGIVLIEAMMFGAAIVTCAAGGIGEVVQDERTALVVAPDDVAVLSAALRRVLADQALRLRLGTAARAAYERRFEPDAVAADMAAFFMRVRQTGVRRRRLRVPWRRPRPGFVERVAALVGDGLGIAPAEATIATRRLLGLPVRTRLRTMLSLATATKVRQPQLPR
jgi:glycogen(starch) synthase